MNEEQIFYMIEQFLRDNNIFSFDGEFYPSREFTEAMFGEKRNDTKKCVLTTDYALSETCD